MRTQRLLSSTAAWFVLVAVTTAAAATDVATPSASNPTTNEPTTNEPTEPLLVREQRLLSEGYALRKLGRDREALEKFQHAFELRHDARPLAQMALAKVALGDWVGAFGMLDRALRDGAHVWIRENRQLLESELDRIAAMLGQLSLDVRPAAATVILDGQDVGLTPLEMPLRLNPGLHVVEVTRRGYSPFREEMRVEAGGRYRRSIVLQQKGHTSSEPKTKQSSAVPSVTRKSQRNPMWLGIAAGGAVLSLSALIPWSIANRRLDALEDDCRAGRRCDLTAARSAIGDLDGVTNVLLISGIVTAAAATAIYFTLPSTTPTPKARLQPWLLSQAFGLHYDASF